MTHFRIKLGKLNDKNAAINLYISNVPLKLSNGDMKEGFGGWCGISKEKRDENVNFAVVSATFGDNEMKPPKYNTIFHSIATHALVSAMKSCMTVLQRFFLARIPK